MRASSAYDAAIWRWATLLAAFTKSGEPSAATREEANPGVKPLRWDVASTTGAAQAALDDGPDIGVQVLPLQPARGAAVRDAHDLVEGGGRMRSLNRSVGGVLGDVGQWRVPSNTRRKRHVSQSRPAAAAPQPGSTDPAIIRNFCIIAHIDHGKSTLADRMLQLTGVVDARAMRAQYLDRMDIERERGITIKSQAVRMPWTAQQGERAGETFVLNMIDTPGHVDFTYEVSRSLEACEAAVLLVDAAQGIEAQTLANLYLALGADLTIIPVLNKIDLPGAEPEKYAAELAGIIGCDPSDVLRVSAKTGEGVADAARRDRPADAGAGRGRGRPAPGPDLRLGLRHLPRRRHLRPGRSTASSPTATGSR